MARSWTVHIIQPSFSALASGEAAKIASPITLPGRSHHVVPPKPDENGYGIRVPGLVISPYAKRGYIDHQTLSHDAYLKFIEDVFLGGARLDPTTDGRSDARPSVRENAPILGDLSKDFDFTQPPRKPSR